MSSSEFAIPYIIALLFVNKWVYVLLITLLLHEVVKYSSLSEWEDFERRKFMVCQMSVNNIHPTKESSEGQDEKEHTFFQYEGYDADDEKEPPIRFCNTINFNRRDSKHQIHAPIPLPTS